MVKARPKPSKPEIPVNWQTTEAQEAGTITAPVKDGRGEMDVRRQRFHLIEHIAKKTRVGERQFPALISKRQEAAGIMLLEAWLETQRSPAPTTEYVDKTPDWDAIALGQVERKWRLADISAFVPRECKDVVDSAIRCQILMAEDIDRLKVGLDAIADGVRLP